MPLFIFLRRLSSWRTSILFGLALTMLSLGSLSAQPKVTLSQGQFYKNGKPYYFIGTNFWYGPILGMATTPHGRERLKKELDQFQKLGIDNLRILVGAEPASSPVTSVQPYLQPQPGKIDENVLKGLDYLLHEMEKRDMVAVCYLTNAWDWSGGYSFYLKASGHGAAPDATKDWKGYCAYAAQMNTDSIAQKLYHEFIQKVIGRRNTITHRDYKDEPAIMAWQICNEPRPFMPEANEDMVKFISSTARLIKSIDPNHLVSIGSEGTIGCAYDENLYQRLLLSDDVDYATLHIWPKNWNWTSNDALFSSLPHVYLKSTEYMNTNLRIAKKLHLPLVIEEFGYPRDKGLFAPDVSTKARDRFYTFIFTQVLQSAEKGGTLAGCNFWGWGGKGRPKAEKWQPGDDFICDPPHEPQGWYSVFDSDTTTLQLIKAATTTLHSLHEQH